MNYDVYGFPRELYEFRYAAPGDPAVAREVAQALDGHIPVYADTAWGFDHGTWLPLVLLGARGELARHQGLGALEADAVNRPPVRRAVFARGEMKDVVCRRQDVERAAVRRHRPGLDLPRAVAAPEPRPR